MKMSRRFLVVSAASFAALVALAGPASAHAEIAWIEKDTGSHSESRPPAPQFGVLINDRAAVTVAAESDASPSTTARMATQSNAITDEGSETSTAGQYVFIGVCAVLVGGAGALFLKYRKKSPKV
ncbi:MAG: hypothetical protein JHC63_05095 [Acidimicrobiia bacterium]|nr:hypothetical protein [Acidimicrobiia bacterium]